MRAISFVGLTFLVLSACSSDDSDGGGSGGAQTGGSGGTQSGGTGGATGGGAGSSVGGSAGTSAGDTWGNFAQGFFTTYCIECHGAGDTQRDYSTLDDIIRDQDGIACGVSPVALAGCAAFPPPGQFPIDNATKTNPKPDTAARERLVQWIQAGLPE